jgi:GTPase
MIKEGTSKEEIFKYSEIMPSGKICPIFSVSSVTNAGFPELIYFISKLNNRDQLNNLIRSPESPLEFDTN